MEKEAKIIVMGGSWGGIKAATAVLQGLPATFSIPIVLVLHRLRSQDSFLQEIFARQLALKVREVEEKEAIEPGVVYLAPSNYHVLLEKDLTFSLDASELENYSRPSIDVTFCSAADVFGPATIGIVLTGASKDGSAGLKYISERGGKALVQDPQEAEIDTMPLAAINQVPASVILSVTRIQAYLLSLHGR